MGNLTGGGWGYLFSQLLPWHGPGIPSKSHSTYIMHQPSLIIGNGNNCSTWNTDCSTWNIMAFCIAMIWLVLGVA